MMIVFGSLLWVALAIVSGLPFIVSLPFKASFLISVASILVAVFVFFKSSMRDKADNWINKAERKTRAIVSPVIILIGVLLLFSTGIFIHYYTRASLFLPVIAIGFYIMRGTDIEQARRHAVIYESIGDDNFSTMFIRSLNPNVKKGGDILLDREELIQEGKE